MGGTPATDMAMHPPVRTYSINNSATMSETPFPIHPAVSALLPSTRGPSSGICFQDLQSNFDQPLAVVARKLNVCTTFFKKMCRHFGIKRWPFRKLKSLEKKAAMLEAKGTSVKSSALLAQCQRQLAQTRAFARTDSDVDSESNDAEDDSPSNRTLDRTEYAFTPAWKLQAGRQDAGRNPSEATFGTSKEQETLMQLEAEVCLRLSSMFKRNWSSGRHEARGTADVFREAWGRTSGCSSGRGRMPPRIGRFPEEHRA